MEAEVAKKMEKLEATSSESVAERVVMNLLGQEPSSSKQIPKAPTIKPVARSSVLDRVKMFLPQMEEANQKLLEVQNPDDLDIEKISQQHQGNYIEFNLSCTDLEDERLGVLKEIVANNGSSDSENSSEDEDMGEKEKKSKAKPKKKLITEIS